jgi:PilZ domain-containing protein
MIFSENVKCVYPGNNRVNNIEVIITLCYIYPIFRCNLQGRVTMPKGSKNKTASKERRQHKRTAVQIWASEQGAKVSSYHLLTNLSSGGFYIEKKLPFKSGAIIELKLDIKGSGSDEKICVKGEVVNNYVDAGANYQGCGVRFMELSTTDMEKISNYLRQLTEDNQTLDI